MRRHRFAQISADTPELMCTTVPPAKSSAPPAQYLAACSLPYAKAPPPHTQWHNGQYTSSPHRIMNTTIVLNFIRSAKAPQIRAGVMMKNIP